MENDQNNDPPQSADALAAEQTEAAASEAGAIGGQIEPLSDDPAEAPVLEAGGGVSEGQELSEEDLLRNVEDQTGLGAIDAHTFPPEKMS